MQDRTLGNRSTTRERPASNGETRKNFCTSKYSLRVHAQLVIGHHGPRVAHTLCQSPSAYARSFHSQFLAQLSDAPGEHLLQVGHLKDARQRVKERGSHLIAWITNHPFRINRQPCITRT